MGLGSMYKDPDSKRISEPSLLTSASGIINSSAVTFTKRIDPDLSTASSGISFIVTLTVASTQWKGTSGSFSSVTFKC